MEVNGNLGINFPSQKKILLALVVQTIIVKMALDLKNWHVVVQQGNFSIVPCSCAPLEAMLSVS